MTAVEWLVNQLEKYDIHKPTSLADWSVLKELARDAMKIEWEQITTAYKIDMDICSDEDAEEYYNQTFNK